MCVTKDIESLDYSKSDNLKFYVINIKRSSILYKYKKTSNIDVFQINNNFKVIILNPQLPLPDIFLYQK